MEVAIGVEDMETTDVTTLPFCTMLPTRAEQHEVGRIGTESSAVYVQIRTWSTRIVARRGF